MFILKELVLHFVRDERFKLGKHQLEIRIRREVKGNMGLSLHGMGDETHLVVECKAKDLNDGLLHVVYLMKKKEEEGVNYLFLEFSNFVSYSFLLTRLTSFFSKSHMACSSTALIGRWSEGEERRWPSQKTTVGSTIR